MIVAFLAAAVAPAGADAFVGESVVIDTAKTPNELTGPAKTILTNPTFLEDFEDAAPEPQKKGLLRTLMGSRALPMIGRLLPAVGGAFIAYEVCNAVMSGCLSFESEDSEAPGTPNSSNGWIWTNRGVEDGGLKSGPMTYYMNVAHFKGYGGVPPDCTNGSVTVGPTMVLTQTSEWSIGCGGAHGTIKAHKAMPLRTPVSQNVNYAGGVGEAPSGNHYCRGWGASDGCTSSVDSSGWSAAAAAGLQSHVDPEVGQWVAAQIAPGEVANPYVTKVEIPDCSGASWGACRDTLEELELVPERVELDWQTADIALAPNEVVELQPAPATTVETGTKVVVTTNPPSEGMPLVVPVISPGETYDEYISKLAPSLDPEKVVLSPELMDPNAGPNAAVRTSPAPGTRLNPESSHNVQVQTNPATAPAPAGGWVAPTLPGIDMGPFMSLPTPCSIFPFGLLCWLGEGLAQFNTSGNCPDMKAPLTDDVDYELTLCTDVIETVLSYVRPLLIFAWTIGCGFLFARATRAIGGE